MSPAKKFFSGNTVEQAVLQAARHFQLEPEQVAYEPVERRHGFLKVRRRVVIGVDPTSPKRSDSPVADDTNASSSRETAEGAAAAPMAPMAPTPADQGESAQEPQREPGPGSAGREETEKPREDSRTDTAWGDERIPAVSELSEPGEPGEPAAAAVPARPEESAHSGDAPLGARDDAWQDVSEADATEAAGEGLRRIFRLGRLDLEWEITTTEGVLNVELSGPDEDELFEDRGRLLLAVQHLLPRMVRGLTGGAVACKVDSDNFHEVRAEQLRVIAQDAASEVRRERRMQTLEPMSPDERRIVHLTLADDPAVETESHGSGLFKRVAIRPVRRSERDSDRYRR